MSLDGLRAWIGEVERKLGMRTRVFLVLVAVAIGAGAAGIYLALEAANESVSKDEVRELRETAATGVSEGGTTAEAATIAALRQELKSLQDQVAELQGAATAESGGKGASAESGGKDSSQPSKGVAPTESDQAAPGAESPVAPKKLKELIEKAK